MERGREASVPQTRSVVCALVNRTWVIAAGLPVALLSGCGKSHSADPQVVAAVRPEVVVTFDGPRNACGLSRPGDANSQSMPCIDVTSYLVKTLKLPRGSLFDYTTIPDVNLAEFDRVKSSGGLQRPLDPALAGLFTEVLEPGVNIVTIWCEVNMGGVEAILAQVRSRLLDFMLELRDVVGTEAGPKVLAEKAATIDAGKMFYASIYNISTAGGAVIVGSQNFQINNQRGDVEGVIREIAKLGYDKAELDSLREAMLEDRNKGKTPDITEGETSKWYLKALKKAGEGALEVTTDVVAQTIAKVFEHFVKGV